MMTKKKRIKLEKLTDNISYQIIDDTIYLYLNKHDLKKENLSLIYQKTLHIMEKNELHYVNLSGVKLEDNKEYYQNLGFKMAYYDVNKLNILYDGKKNKELYKCYATMNKETLESKLPPEKKVTNSSAGYINNLLLLFGGLILLCYFCVQGAIYLVR